MSNTKANIEIILNLPGNRSCADCASLVDEDTGWASLNLGVVMCIQCAGIHRAMGTHITKIRSFRLDTNAWTDKITCIFTTIGGNNRANNAVWESYLPSFWINPKIDCGSDRIRKAFIKSKYEKQLFLPPDELRGRINNCLRKMPIEVRQIECDFWVRGDKKYKTKEFLVIHSRWLSRYTSSKKTKSIQKIDLTNYKLLVEENTTGFEEYDGFEFSLYEDNKYIVNHSKSPKEIDNYTNVINEEKNNIQNVFVNDEPLLRVRIKEFKQFVLTIQDIRSTMAYYRVYDSLFEIEPDSPPLNLTRNDLELTTTKFLGYAKIGWSRRYFACINGFIYQFKEDISSKPDIVPTALTAWDLQIMDCVLDDNGKRSGSKFAVLIINNNKTISLKFQSGPEAIVFFTQLKQCWTNTRGKYYVDFSINPPEISGDANAPQPIQIGNQSPISHKGRQKSSFYMPNPQNGTPLVSPKEQDAVILQLIDQYEKKQTKLRTEQSATFTIDTNIGGDISSTNTTGTGSGTTDDDNVCEGSDKFELSESDDDPLYRQVSQMTKEEKNQYANKNVQLNYVGGIPTYQNNLDIPGTKQNTETNEIKENNVEQVMKMDLNTLTTMANNNDSDSYHTEPDTNDDILSETNNENEIEQAMHIEQQITMKNKLHENGNQNHVNNIENGYENENANQVQNDINNIENNGNYIENDIHNAETTSKRVSGIVEQMKATLEKNDIQIDEPLSDPLVEYELKSSNIEREKIPIKPPMIIESNTSQTKSYNNSSIDGASNLSISALLKQQQKHMYTQPESSPEIIETNNVNVSSLLKQQQQQKYNQTIQSQPEPEPESEPQPEPEESAEIVETANVNVSSLLKQQQQSYNEQIETKPEPEIVETNNINVSALLNQQQQPEMEPEPEIVETENINVSVLLNQQNEPEIIESNNINVSLLLKQQQNDEYTNINQIQPESEPEPSPEIVETANLNVSLLLQKQNEPIENNNNNEQKSEEEIIETTNFASIVQKEQEDENNNNNLPESLQPPSVNTDAEIVRADSSKSLSPKLSLTQESEAADNMATAAVAVAVDIENEIKQSENKIIENKNEIKQSESEIIQPNPKPKPIEKKAFTAPINNSNNNRRISKTYETTNTFKSNTGMNKTGGVAEKLAMFNQKNNATISRRNNPNSIRNKNRKKKIINGSSNVENINTNNNSRSKPIDENNSITMNKMETEPLKKRRHKHKKKRRQKKKKEVINLHMQHLKITRWFNIDKKQLAKLNNPSFTNALQQQLAKFGILSVRNDKSYIKIKISRRIALPQRQQHWNNTLELLQNKLQGTNLCDNETIVND